MTPRHIALLQASAVIWTAMLRLNGDLILRGISGQHGFQPRDAVEYAMELLSVIEKTGT